MEPLINAHAHIFNVKSAPNRFYGFPIARLLGNRLVAWKLERVLRMLAIFNRDFFDKYANMLKVGSTKSQTLLFEDLLDKYGEYPGVRVVALPMDMDFMGAGKAMNNYPTQLAELYKVKLKYLDQLIPFVAVDPRRAAQTDLLAMVKEHIEERGFAGIKLYPALGYYPFDPRLKEVYAYAEQYNIPIMTHCDTGGVFYRGKLRTEHLKPENLNPNGKVYDFTSERKERKSVFKNNFTNPDNYRQVLAVFPKLKICLAHFGSSDQILGSKGGDHAKDIGGSSTWYDTIKDLIMEFDNVYTDVSYTLTNKKAIDVILKEINKSESKRIRERVLFGTDYYMTVRVKGETKLVDQFFNQVGEEDFDQFQENNRSYISMDYAGLTTATPRA